MPEKQWDIAGLRAAPWATAAGAPHRAALDPTPFGDPFMAAAWSFTKKGEFEPKYRWRAGRKFGPAKSLDEAKDLADASLSEQGVVLNEPACTCTEEKTFCGTRTILCRRPGCLNSKM